MLDASTVYSLHEKIKAEAQTSITNRIIA